MPIRRTPGLDTVLVLTLLAVSPLAGQSAVGPAAATSSTPAPATSPHQLAFDRLKALEGKWRGKSTKGWEEDVTYRTIAGGSVVMSTSFDAHPGETMATMFHLDQGTLMLTHYCVGKSQPRLVATEVSPDGRRILFTFKDVTGIPSRDAGHMDKALYEFVDENHTTTQWTWYAQGQERWMEKIELERIR